MELYAITTNTDLTEGRGRTINTGIFFTDYEEALKFVQSERHARFSCMGFVNPEYSHYDIKNVFEEDKYRRYPVGVFETVEEYDLNMQNLDAKNKLLKKIDKMTDAEAAKVLKKLA
jgi:hypothetical protein